MPIEGTQKPIAEFNTHNTGNLDADRDAPVIKMKGDTWATTALTSFRRGASVAASRISKGAASAGSIIGGAAAKAGSAIKYGATHPVETADKAASYAARGAILGLGGIAIGLGTYIFHMVTLTAFLNSSEKVGKAINTLPGKAFEALYKATAVITDHTKKY